MSPTGQILQETSNASRSRPCSLPQNGRTLRCRYKVEQQKKRERRRHSNALKHPGKRPHPAFKREVRVAIFNAKGITARSNLSFTKVHRILRR